MTPMQAWERALVSTYADIARTRMAGLPLMHPGLHVQSVGMRDHDEGWLTVLLTPWFMNLVWRAQEPSNVEPLPAGLAGERRVGMEVFSFVGVWNDQLGPFEACSLISPMFQFVDQDAAVATAQMVLRELFPARKASPKLGEALAAGSMNSSPQAAAHTSHNPSTSPMQGQGASQQPVDQRRRFLFGFRETRG